MHKGQGESGIDEFLPYVFVPFIPVEIETAFEPPPHPIDSKGLESLFVQKFCQQFCVRFPERGHVFGSHFIAVMDDAMGPRVSSGEYGGKALIRGVPAGKTVGELDAFASQSIDVGAGHGQSSVTPEIPGTERIDDDKDDVGVLLWFFLHAYHSRGRKATIMAQENRLINYQGTSHRGDSR
jgi:hypothetical protein